ncbi:Phosphoribosylglycinamide formyltransferase [Roseibium album]|nr:Phosphoribosylglycinamide formyltransferase [Roseibium album]
MRVGALCSAGGAAFFTAVDMAVSEGLTSYEEIFLVTDRPCGAELQAAERSITFSRIEKTENQDFSRRAGVYLGEAGCRMVLLYFTRLVTSELFQRLPTLNIHPSLLPSFPGFGALSAAVRHKTTFIGATLHLVAEGVDNGPIVAQVASPVLGARSGKELESLSYMHKCYLTLCALDLLDRGQFCIDVKTGTVTLPDELRVTASSAPALQSKSLIGCFKDFLTSRSEGERYFVP